MAVPSFEFSLISHWADRIPWKSPAVTTDVHFETVFHKMSWNQERKQTDRCHNQINQKHILKHLFELLLFVSLVWSFFAKSCLSYMLFVFTLWLIHFKLDWEMSVSLRTGLSERTNKCRLDHSLLLGPQKNPALKYCPSQVRNIESKIFFHCYKLKKCINRT